MGKRIKSFATVFAMICSVLSALSGEKVLASENAERIIREYLYQMYGYDRQRVF